MIEVNWLLFVAASLMLIIVPGQDMILVMSRSIAQGAVAGVATATGVCSGLVVHTVVAALGLCALIRTSEWLYLGLQMVGAVYLAYLGVQLLRAPQQQLAIAGSALKRPARMFFDGAPVQHLQPEDRRLLPRVPAPVRGAGCHACDAVPVRPRARLRRARTARQGPLGWCAG